MDKQKVTILPNWGMTCGNFFKRAVVETPATVMEGQARIGGNVLVKVDVDSTGRTWEVPKRGLREYAELYGEVSE